MFSAYLRELSLNEFVSEDFLSISYAGDIGLVKDNPRIEIRDVDRFGIDFPDLVLVGMVMVPNEDVEIGLRCPILVISDAHTVHIIFRLTEHVSRHLQPL